MKTATRNRARGYFQDSTIIGSRSIGRDILARQAEQGWGAKVTTCLSADLHREFPDMKGLSPRNLVYMQTLASAYSEEFAQQAVAQIPWGHNCIIAHPKIRPI